MLEEAIGIIRALWTGDEVSHRGPHYTVENATLYTRPEVPPPLLVAASGPEAAELAGRTGDGFISTAPVAALVDEFEQARSAMGRPHGAPRYGQLTVCWAADEEEGTQDGPRVVAQLCLARRAQCRAAGTSALRTGDCRRDRRADRAIDRVWS